MSVLFTQTEIALLRAPHVAQAWFVQLDLPSGASRLHNGVGTINIGGFDWRGISDPIAGVLVGISGLEEPTIGSAAAVNLTLSGASRAFFQSVDRDARRIEGRYAAVYFAVFNGETQAPISSLVPLFFHGRMSSPKIRAEGIGLRTVSLTIEGPWAGLGFRTGRKWNGAGQRAAYPGDAGMDYVGQKVNESWI